MVAPSTPRPASRHLNYGNSDYDARHRFVALYTYEIPVLSSMKDNFIVNEILGRWHVSGTSALQTGFPVSHFRSRGISIRVVRCVRVLRMRR